jgi:uncharacterized protein (DUF58 family)
VKIDWDRLNHVLIPVPTAARRRTAKPLPKRVQRLIELAFSLTPTGQVTLVGASLLGAISLALPASRVPYLFGFVLGLFVVSIALRRFFRLDRGPDASKATLEQAIRVTVGEPLTVRVVVATHERADALSVRGPFLPWFARYEGEPPVLGVDRGTGLLSARATVRFTRRADLFLGAFAVAKRLPFDLVAGPPIETEPFRIKIVPRPARIGKLDLPPAREGTSLAAGAKRGGLTDLAGVREYRSGDRVRDLDARTWARTGVPFVREYEDPEMTRAILLFDTEGEEGEAFEAAVSLAAGVAEATLDGGLALELFVVGEALHRLDAGRGRAALPLVLDALSVAEPTKRFDGLALVARVAPHLRYVSAVVFVTTKWDTARAEVAETLAKRGPTPRVVIVAEAASAIPSYARTLTPSTVRRGGFDL